MYREHFGLSQLPFSLTPDTEFFYELQPHIEALQVLLTALHSGEGFIKVTGEVGTGKTMLCRKLLNEMPNEYKLAYLPNPCLSPMEISQALANELDIKTPQKNMNDQVQFNHLLQQKLLSLASENKKVVLLLDEAQALSWESLESLRLLGNLETEKQKLLQIVLFGQPELDERLNQVQFRQLSQRITFSYTLRPLNLNELSRYIEHRLYISGYRGAPLFSSATFKLLYKATSGIPRLINVICHKSLMLSYGKGERLICTNMIKTAINDTQAANQAFIRPFWLYALSTIVMFTAIGLFVSRSGL